MNDIIQSHTASVENLRLTIEDLLERKDKIHLLSFISEQRPADVADAIEMMPMEQVGPLFKSMLLGDVTVCAEVLIEMEESKIAELYEPLTLQEWAWLFAELSDDDVVAILELFPPEASEVLVGKLPEEDQDDILELMTFPEESAGRFMTNEYLSMEDGETVASAVEKVRSTRELDITNLFQIFVTRNGKLVGLVTLRQLLLAKRQETLGKIMKTDVIAVPANMDQEEVAELFRKHDEVTVPVLDDKGQILGIITVDDVIDVIDEESEEDIFALIGTSDEERLAGNDISKIVGLRLPWIFASFCGSMLVAWLMSVAEKDLFENAARLFIFVPLVCAMGGNVGVQSATIMARLLSSSDPDWSEARRATLKEARVGLNLGAICGLAVGGFAWIWQGREMMITVMLAMIAAMTTAATTGTVIPVFMKKMGFDPALATGPFVTSFNDVVATLVYFTIAFNLMQ